MKNFTALWERLLASSIALCAALILAIAAMTTYEVVARGLFDAPTTWAQEVAGYLLVACAFFGFAPTLHAGEHIRIDLLVRRLKQRARAALELVVFLAIAVFAGVAAWGGYEMVAQSLEYGRKSLTLLAVPVWIPQLVVPIGMTLLCMVAVLRAWRLIRQLHAGPSA